MKYLIGFLMAWGNFSAIPCPYRGWHEESRKAMLTALPLVGLMLALITAVCWWLLEMAGLPAVFTGTAVTAVYFCCTGFIHLDGFMDCSDAIMSRRPELEERQRILKDPTVGAFAVICVVLMFMIFAASAAALAGEWAVPFGYAKGSVSPLGFNLLNKFLVLAGIMVTSRYIAASDVLRRPAMSSSQYAELGQAKESGFGGREGVVLSLVSSFLIVVMMFIAAELPGALMLSRMMLVYGGAVIAAAVTAGITGCRDRRNLGGMNGDIAGHMITMSEMMGMAAAAVVFSAV